MSPEQAEKWIVNLIRNARLDAKIDAKMVFFSQKHGLNYKIASFTQLGTRCYGHESG